MDYYKIKRALYKDTNDFLLKYQETQEGLEDFVILMQRRYGVGFLTIKKTFRLFKLNLLQDESTQQYSVEKL